MDAFTRQSPDGERLFKILLASNLVDFHMEMRGQKALHASIILGGPFYFRELAREGMKRLRSVADAQADLANVRMTSDDCCALFWAKACDDWLEWYGAEDPRVFLAGHEPEGGFEYPDPETEKVDIKILPAADDPGWLERNFRTERRELEGITPVEFGKLSRSLDVCGAGEEIRVNTGRSDA